MSRPCHAPVINVLPAALTSWYVKDAHVKEKSINRVSDWQAGEGVHAKNGAFGKKSAKTTEKSTQSNKGGTGCASGLNPMGEALTPLI